MLTRAELVELMGTTQTRYFHDNFKNIDHINQAVTQTGYIDAKMHDLKLETGVQSASTARIYYTNPIYNPKYSILQIKARMSSIQDVTAFFGFNTTTTYASAPPALKIAGILITGGVVHAITGNGDDHVTTPLTDVDLTDNWLFKIEFDKFSTRPLPVVYPYFDGLRIEKPTRAWSVAAQHGYLQPENEYHYIIAQIANTTGADKVLELKHITYSEEYAD